MRVAVREPNLLFLSLFLADAAVLSLASFSVFEWGGFATNNSLGAFSSAVVLTVFASTGAYAMGLYQSSLITKRAFWRRALVALVPSAALAHAMLAGNDGRSLGANLAVVLMVCSWMAALVANRLLTLKLALSHFKRKIVTLGPVETVAPVMAELQSHIPFVWLEHVPSFLTAGGLPKAIDANCVDEMVVCDRYAAEHFDDVIASRMAGLPLVTLTGFVERECRKIDLQNQEAVARCLVSPGRSALSRLVKRVLDVVLSSVILVFLIPVMAAVALAVLLCDRGPILYSQERVGEHGRKFRLYKFRTMRADAESDGKARWAQLADPRLTAIGGFLRKSRLDELPQLINVLAGQMSIVGPRPERPSICREIAAQAPLFACRTLVPPGITGWAQVNLPYGASIDESIEKAGYDLYYIKNGSTLLDFAIMLQTVRVILFAEGAR